MKTASLTEVKNDLSKFVEQVRRGGSVRILIRGVPAADLVPVSSASSSVDEAELLVLERRGAIRRGKGGFPPELEKPGPKAKGRPASELLIEDRRRGR